MAAKNTKRMRSPELDSAQSDARGFAMAVLLVGIAVMLTLMTMAMPVWRQQVKREKEEELLFRLRQYAHALALYQRKLPGAAPSNVDELVKQKFLRRKYTDPMTGKEFAILRVGQASPGMTSPLPGMTGSSPATTGRPGQTTTMPGSGFGGTASPTPGGLQPGGPSGTTSTGAMRGVVSTSKESSLRTWKGRTQYDQWEVTVEDITPRFFGQPGQPGQGGRGPRSPFGGNTQPTLGSFGQPTGRPSGPYTPRR